MKIEYECLRNILVVERILGWEKIGVVLVLLVKRVNLRKMGGVSSSFFDFTVVFFFRTFLFFFDEYWVSG